jgi:hypothetical protein
MRIYALPIIGAAVVFILVLTANVRYTYSDPYHSLLVSQSIIEHGTIYLDWYQDVGLKQIIFGYEHKYSIFPLGVPVFSVPFVLIAKLFGWDMRYHDAQLQIIIAAILCSLIFLVLYLIGRQYLSRFASFFVVLISILGSSLISTLGTALWSHIYAVLFISVSLLLIVKDRLDGKYSYLLGGLLFAAFLSRPLSAIFIVLTLVFLFFRDKKIFLRAAATAFALVVVLVFFSLQEFNKPLPDSYMPDRLWWGRPIEVAPEPGDPTHYYSHSVIPTPMGYWLKLYGLFLSPSRGLLVYSPFVLIVLVGVVRYVPRLRSVPVFWLVLTWVLLVCTDSGSESGMVWR